MSEFVREGEPSTAFGDACVVAYDPPTTPRISDGDQGALETDEGLASNLEDGILRTDLPGVGQREFVKFDGKAVRSMMRVKENSEIVGPPLRIFLGPSHP
jgi:hypothetical protein